MMQITKNYQLKTLTLNKPQWRSVFNLAPIIFNVWSRGTGKTFDQAYHMKTLAHNLPRGVVALVGRTLDQMMQNTLPGVMQTLEEWGYREWDGNHGDYVVGKRPPEHWPHPFAKRLKYDKCISWKTGTAFMLISQERTGSGRGPSFDAIMADEALTLKPDHLRQEVIAANRGNNHRFRSTPYHHSQKYWTSKPFVGQGRWIDDYAQYYQNEYNIDLFARNNDAAKLMLAFVESRSKHERALLWKDISAFLRDDVYRTSRKGVYYNEAVVFDNISNLGWNYIKTLHSSLTPFQFNVEVMNMTVNAAETSFYHISPAIKHDPPSFYESSGIHLLNHHTVTPYDLDTDIVRTEPLDIACDANYGINTMVVGQLVETEYRILNGLYVKKPKLIRDNAQQFCDYYARHPKKHVRFFFDHTFIHLDAGRAKSFKDMITEVLYTNGWTVEERYIGQQPNQHSRYETINQYLMGTQPVSVAINASRAQHVYTALESTGVRIVNGEFKKDKRPEGDDNAKQEHTTHFTDAFDTLIIGRLVQLPTMATSPIDEIHRTHLL